MQKPGKHTIESIQLLRALATLTVLIHHTNSMEKKYTGLSWLGFIFEHGGYASYGICLFFMISGFVLTYIAYDKASKPAYWRPFMLQRLWRIYPPYWCVNIAILAVYLYQPAMVFTATGEHPAPDILGSFLLTSPVAGLLLVVGWTITYELCFYFIFSLVFFIRKHPIRSVLTGWIALLAAGQYFRPQDGYSCYLLNILSDPLGCQFIAGMLIACLYKKLGSTIPKHLTAALLLPTLAYILLLPPLLDYVSAPWKPVLRAIIPESYLMLLCLRYEPQLRVSRLVKPLLLIGNASYSLYLVHIPALALIARIGSFLALPNTPAWHAAWLSAMLGFTLLVGILMYRMVEIPLLALMRPAPPTQRPT